jgi:hypothetical protein
MKINLSLIVILAGLICCARPHREDPVKAEPVVQDLHSTSSVYDPLTPKQIKQVERIHTAFSEVSSRSLDETIINFKRSPNPAEEIAVWIKMADAYERFTLNKHIEEYDKKYEAYQLILHRSMMTEREVIEKVDIIYLTRDEIKVILGYYIDSQTRHER